MSVPPRGAAVPDAAAQAPPTRRGKYGGLSRKPIRSWPCPRASSRAAPTVCTGTNPSCRTACASAAPATSTAPRRLSAGWHAFQSRNGRSGCTVRPARYSAIARASVATDRSASARTRGARPVEERPVRLLRRVRKDAPERVDEDRRAAVDDRKRVAPEPKRKAEAEIRRAQRVRPLTRDERRHARNPDHEGAKRLVELRTAAFDRAEQRLRVRDRRRPAVRGRDRDLRPQRAEHVPPQRLRQRAVHEPERRPRDPLQRVRVVRVAAHRAAERRVVEDERHADQGNAPRECTLERDREMPALRRRGLEERVRACRAEGVCAGSAEERRGTAVHHRLRSADDDDEIGLDEGTVDTQRRPRAAVERDELLVLDVVHDDVAVEPAREVGRHERLELALRRPPCKPGSDEQRLVARRDAEPLELVDDGGDGELARVERSARDRQRRRLDDDRRARGAPRERLERVALEREAERVAHGRADVRDRLTRRRRPQDDRVVGCRRDDEPRAREERDSRHYRPGTCRTSLMCVSSNPRAGQYRDATRLVTRQLVRNLGKPRSAATASACAVSARPMPLPRSSGRTAVDARWSASASSGSGYSVVWPTWRPSRSAT